MVSPTTKKPGKSTPLAVETAPHKTSKFSEFIVGSGEVLTHEGNTVEFKNATIESIAGSPDGAYPDGSGVVMQFDIDGLPVELSLLSDGYESKSVHWHYGFMVEVVKYDDEANKVHLHIGRVGDQTTGDSETLRVETKGEISLPDGNTMRFEYHTHKRTHVGQKSPLVVHVSYWNVKDLPDGIQVREALGEKSYNLGPPAAGASWSWRATHFELLSHQYSRFMELKVTPLVVEPLFPDKID